LQVTDKLNPKKTDPDLQESVAMSQVDFDLSSIIIFTSSCHKFLKIPTIHFLSSSTNLTVHHDTRAEEARLKAFEGALPLMTAKAKPSAFVAPGDGGHDRLLSKAHTGTLQYGPSMALIKRRKKIVFLSPQAAILPCT